MEGLRTIFLGYFRDIIHRTQKLFLVPGVHDIFDLENDLGWGELMATRGGNFLHSCGKWPIYSGFTH